MANKVLFDPITKIIEVIEPPVSGTVNLDFQVDVYSDGKEDWITDPILNKIKFPIRGVGGDSISDTKSLGATFFLLYGWQIRPYSADHKLLVNGNIYTDPAGGNVFLPASGSYSVTIETTVSNLTDSTIQQLPQIEYASFQNGVTVDVNSPYFGIAFPVGTPEQPVNNLIDAKSIATYRGFTRIYLRSDISLDSGIDFEFFNFVGQSHTNTMVDVLPAAFVSGAVFSNIHIGGTLDGHNELNSCVVHDLMYVNGHIHNSGLSGYIELAGNADAVFADCKTVDPYNPPIIDMGGSGQNLAMPNYSGILTITNLTGSNFVGIGLDAGQVYLDTDNITSGTFQIVGIGLVTDMTGSALQTGPLPNGGYLINEWMSKATISEAVLNTSLIPFTDLNTVAHSLRTTNYTGIVSMDATSPYSGSAYPAGTVSFPVNNITDAAAICADTGIDTIHINGNYTFSSSVFISGLHLVGSGKQSSTFTFENGAITANCSVESAKITGYVLGFTGYTDCFVVDVTSSGAVPSSAEVIIRDCIIQGVTSIPGNFTGKLDLLDCWAFSKNGVLPTLNMNGGDFDVGMRNFSGFFGLVSCSQDNDVRIYLSQGGIILDNSVTSGSIVLSGVGTLIDSSSGAIVDTTSLINQTTIAVGVWDEQIANHLIVGSTGLSIGQSQFAGEVEIEASGQAGTAFPIGTKSYPVNNLPDALIIAQNNGIDTLCFESDFTISASQNISGYRVRSEVHSTLTLEPGALTYYTNFSTMTVTGYTTGYTIFDNCTIKNLYNFYGIMDRCIFNAGTIQISSDNTKNAIFFDCYTGDVSGPPTFDMNGDGAKLSMRGLTGAFLFTNKTGATQNAFIDLYSARVGFDSTVVTGSFTVRGIGVIYLNDSTNTTFNTDGLMSKATVAEASWDEPLVNHVIPGTTGNALSALQYGGKVWLDPTSPYSGSIFPAGTQKYPVNNGPDALTIAIANGIDTFAIQGTFTTTTNLTEYTIAGDTFLDDGLTFNNTSYDTVTFADLHLDGTGSFTNTEFKNCYIENLNGLSGEMFNCRLSGDIVIEPGKTLSGIEMVIEGDFTTIDFQNATGSVFSCDINSGYVLIKNMVSGSLLEVNMKGGEIELDSSITGGDFYAEGIGTLFGDPVALGMTVKDNHLIANETIATYVWDEQLGTYVTPGSAGYALSNVSAGASPALIAQAVWNDTASLYTATSSFGYSVTANDTNLQLILGLVQHNFRMTNQVYDANGNMTAAEVNIYPSSADASAQTNSINTYYITAVYDANNRLIDYKMVE